jgi:tol-pal system protein YbgF
MIMALRQKSSGLMASFLLAIFISATASAQQASSQQAREPNQAMIDLVLQVQQLQDEVRMLTGMLENQTLELENLSNRQRDQYLDLDQRITGMRGTSPGPMISSTPAGAGGAVTTAAVANNGQPEVQPRIDADVPDVRQPLDTASSVTALATPDAQAREFAASPEAEKESYDRAFQSLKELKYADAAQQFQSFLGVYPASDYADNAQYWLGESYYVTRNYEIALDAFKDLLAKYPDSPKVPDGLLKIGYTHYELKQWDQARAALEQVEQQYPGTTLARLAGSRLRSMKLEGHF